ncbi:Cdc6-like AAA superfamily ATPase [Microbacterium foliorum]|uniref:nSTAND1 domain-containing NTPase n=1 Tax=Microbacterium foliorum TaxID=104336 RepID=UPI0020A0BDB0|nr:AAA family ATPase [Microbacterium foliorum]MCP1427529.1 Cdc6-like AAA superfamily ATPase [Microbacterium foliorum]
MDDIDHMNRLRAVKSAFSPTAPIQRKDLFAGRVAQLIALMDAVDEPGQHVVIFGERGVGKTSLATVSKDMFSSDGSVAVRVNCTAGDSFSDVWHRAFSEIHMTQAVNQSGFNAQPVVQQQGVAAALGLPETLSPDHVRMALTLLARTTRLVIIFDEFDRLAGSDLQRQFADTIKSLSDQVIDATIVIVGVADNVDELITEHASVERALSQISMPRMSVAELADIITKGLSTVEMTIDPAAAQRITRLSQGLPHYTHLIAQQAAMSAFMDASDMIAASHVVDAVNESLAKTQESVSNLYYKATYSARDNMYKQVLLGCALAVPDDRGYFSAAAVRESLKNIGAPMEIPQFAGHLNAFSSDRGPVLRKDGVKRKFRYRFMNPLVQPFVILQGLKDGLLAPDALDT